MSSECPQHNSAADGGSTAAGRIGGQEEDCFTLFVIMSTFTLHLTIQDKQYNAGNQEKYIFQKFFYTLWCIRYNEQ